jgi:hypothetical protein
MAHEAPAVPLACGRVPEESPTYVLGAESR